MREEDMAEEGRGHGRREGPGRQYSVLQEKLGADKGTAVRDKEANRVEEDRVGGNESGVGRMGLRKGGRELQEGEVENMFERIVKNQIVLRNKSDRGQT